MLIWRKKKKKSGNNIQMRSLLIENSSNEGMPFLILRGHFFEGRSKNWIAFLSYFFWVMNDFLNVVYFLYGFWCFSVINKIEGEIIPTYSNLTYETRGRTQTQNWTNDLKMSHLILFYFLWLHQGNTKRIRNSISINLDAAAKKPASQ